MVDVGDPWVVTANPGDWGRVWGRFRGRARAAETFLWENAAAGVVTTATQASRLRSLFPDLNLLCRPNGYEAAETGVGGTGIRRAPSDDLRLIQFGSVYEVRLPIGPWLSRLRQAAGCKTLFSPTTGTSSARAAAVSGSSRGPGIARSSGLAARLRDRPGLRRRPRNRQPGSRPASEQGRSVPDAADSQDRRDIWPRQRPCGFCRRAAGVHRGRYRLCRRHRARAGTLTTGVVIGADPAAR